MALLAFKKFPPPSLCNTTAVVLAGGQGKRVHGRQKALLSYQGKPLLDSVLQQLRPQKLPIFINVNSDDPAYKKYGVTLFSDIYKGFLGPLAGMHAAWHSVKSDWIVFVPCDNPKLPVDMVKRLIKAYDMNPSPLVAVYDGQRLQPLYLLMHRCMQPVLEQAIERSHLSVLRWIKENPHTIADFSDDATEVFQNLNTLDGFKQSKVEVLRMVLIEGEKSGVSDRSMTDILNDAKKRHFVEASTFSKRD